MGGRTRRSGPAPRDVSAGRVHGRGGARATRALLDLPTPPTAIVYGNDLSATAGMAVAQDAGLRLPHDLSVVGFDDVPLASWTSPTLTTCRANPVLWGRAAARALVEMIEHGTTADVELDPATLVTRGSTGPVPVRGSR